MWDEIQSFIQEFVWTLIPRNCANYKSKIIQACTLAPSHAYDSVEVKHRYTNVRLFVVKRMDGTQRKLFQSLSSGKVFAFIAFVNVVSIDPYTFVCKTLVKMHIYKFVLCHSNSNVWLRMCVRVLADSVSKAIRLSAYKNQCRHRLWMCVSIWFQVPNIWFA